MSTFTTEIVMNDELILSPPSRQQQQRQVTNDKYNYQHHHQHHLEDDDESSMSSMSNVTNTTDAYLLSDGDGTGRILSFEGPQPDDCSSVEGPAPPQRTPSSLQQQQQHHSTCTSTTSGAPAAVTTAEVAAPNPLHDTNDRNDNSNDYNVFAVDQDEVVKMALEMVCTKSGSVRSSFGESGKEEQEAAEEDTVVIIRHNDVLGKDTVVATVPVKETRRREEERPDEHALDLEAPPPRRGNNNSKMNYENIWEDAAPASLQEDPAVTSKPCCSSASQRQRARPRKVAMVCFVFCLVVVAALAVVVLSVPRRMGKTLKRVNSEAYHDDDNDPVGDAGATTTATVAPSISPPTGAPPATVAPTGAPTTRADALLDLIENTMPGSLAAIALGDEREDNNDSEATTSSSPQFRAFVWLEAHTDLSAHSPQRILQRYALAVLYYSTGGSTAWANAEGWLIDDDECTWFHSDVASNPCSSRGRYLDLNLSGNKLAGTIPPELSLLGPSLLTLDLSRNALVGGIPAWGDGFVKLQKLDLSWNQLSEPLPEAALGNFAALEEFTVKGNAKLRGSVPAVFAATTTTTTITTNNATAATTSARLLPSLQNLDLSETSLSGPVPEGFCNVSWSFVSVDCDQVTECTCCTVCCFDGLFCARR